MRTYLNALVGLLLAYTLASSIASGEDDQTSTLWSLQPPRQTAPPEVENRQWPRSVIDRFVLAKIEQQGMTPTRDASREALVRRAYFDLIGLPPTPHEVADFLADKSATALEKVVDRLLASPLFGERWGRHWLDVVRFAESSGREFNFTYPHAWPYRNYVIDAFNQDTPYDQFICEQVAGDLLPDRNDDAARIATGFLAVGPKRHNDGGLPFFMDIADDQIDTTFRAVMGLTLACARCHDHKFDPIPTTDYYALAGIFLSTEPLYGTIKQEYSNSPTDVYPFGPDAQPKHVAFAAHQQKLAELRAKRDEKDKEFSKVKYELRSKRGDETQAEDADSELIAELKKQKADLEQQVEAFDKQLEELQASAPPAPKYSVSARDRDKPTDSHVALGGVATQKGDIVPRGFLQAISVPDAPAIDPQQSVRLQLAAWLSSRQNPLTARVMVNRIWHHLFGRGIVETVDNFGTLGKEPSHPELLDYLAREFMHGDWSVKRMIRSMVLCRTYGLSTERVAANDLIDPDNRWFWRATVRRLEAESIRDAILAVSGQLDRTPPEGSTVTALGDKLLDHISFEELQPPSNHRSVYLPVLRDYLPELFELFDFPSPSLVTGRRATTNVSTQTLYLRNSPFVAEQSKHTARRVLNRGPIGDGERIEYLYRLAVSRPPSPEELQSALAFLASAQAKLASDQAEGPDPQLATWAALAQAMFASAEFRYLVDVGDTTVVHVAGK